MPVWPGAENLASTGIRSPDRPARTKSLYGLSRPGPNYYTYIIVRITVLLITEFSKCILLFCVSYIKY